MGRAGDRRLAHQAEVVVVGITEPGHPQLGVLGLVRREKTPTDRRLVWVHATAKGTRLMESARKRRLEVIAGELTGLDRTALSTLERAAEVLESLGG